MASTLDNLNAIKANLIQVLATETAYQVAHGAKPSYSLDGESMSWTEWRSAMLEKIGTLNDLIQIEGGPFELRTRVRT